MNPPLSRRTLLAAACPALLLLAPQAFAFILPPPTMTITSVFTGSPEYYTYTLTDPVAALTETMTTPALSPSRTTTINSYTSTATRNWAVYAFATETLTNPGAIFSNYQWGYQTSTVIYDPVRGTWPTTTDTFTTTNNSPITDSNAFVSEGVSVHYFYDAPSKTAQVHLGVYDPEMRAWNTVTYVTENGGTALTPISPHYVSIAEDQGMVAWLYTSSPGLNTSTIEYAFYDGARHEWFHGSVFVTGWNPFSIQDATLYYYPTKTSPAVAVGYNHTTGSFTNQVTAPISAFTLGASYSSRASKMAVWVADMSVGGSSVINWGDGTETSDGSTYHDYSLARTYTVTQTVGGFAGGSATSSQSIVIP